MLIHRVEMDRKHYQTGGNTRRCVVLHATAGRYPSDYGWLKQGGAPAAPVSCHYYIAPDGTITQFVRDEDIAWHAGQSEWEVDGMRVSGLNAYSIGIELSNNNRGQPYPPEQYNAAVWLTQRLVQQYDIPRSQLVRHLDIAPRRKSDPFNFPWDVFKHAVYDDADPGPVPHWYRVTAAPANVRTDPVLSHNIVMQLQKGSRLHIFRFANGENVDGNAQWAQTSEGLLWIHSSVVEAE